MTHFISRNFYKAASLLGVISFLMLVSCAEHTTSTKTETAPPSKFGYGGTNSDTAFVTDETTTDGSTGASSASTTNVTTTNSAAPNPPANPFLSATPQPAAAARDLPYGTPVPGKPGYVISPYSPNAGYVDVHGFPPGTEVKDPYSQKIFLVP